jgi:hypothetical protein
MQEESYAGRAQYPVPGRASSGVAGLRFPDRGPVSARRKPGFFDQKPGFSDRKTIFALRKTVFAPRKLGFLERKPPSQKGRRPPQAPAGPVRRSRMRRRKFQRRPGSSRGRTDGYGKRRADWPAVATSNRPWYYLRNQAAKAVSNGILPSSMPGIRRVGCGLFSISVMCVREFYAVIRY